MNFKLLLEGLLNKASSGTELTGGSEEKSVKRSNVGGLCGNFSQSMDQLDPRMTTLTSNNNSNNNQSLFGSQSHCNLGISVNKNNKYVLIPNGNGSMSLIDVSNILNDNTPQVLIPIGNESQSAQCSNQSILSVNSNNSHNNNCNNNCNNKNGSSMSLLSISSLENNVNNNGNSNNLILNNGHIGSLLMQQQQIQQIQQMQQIKQQMETMQQIQQMQQIKEMENQIEKENQISQLMHQMQEKIQSDNNSHNYNLQRTQSFSSLPFINSNDSNSMNSMNGSVNGSSNCSSNCSINCSKNSNDCNEQSNSINILGKRTNQFDKIDTNHDSSQFTQLADQFDCILPPKKRQKLTMSNKEKTNESCQNDKSFIEKSMCQQFTNYDCSIVKDKQNVSKMNIIHGIDNKDKKKSKSKSKHKSKKEVSNCNNSDNYNNNDNNSNKIVNTTNNGCNALNNFFQKRQKTNLDWKRLIASVANK